MEKWQFSDEKMVLSGTWDGLSPSEKEKTKEYCRVFTLVAQVLRKYPV